MEVKRELLGWVKSLKLGYYRHTTWKYESMEEELIQGCTPGNRSRGQQRRRWTDDIVEWTGLMINEAAGSTQDRDRWRGILHAANPSSGERHWTTTTTLWLFVSQKRASLFWTITSAFLDEFLHFLHQWQEEKFINNVTLATPPFWKCFKESCTDCPWEYVCQFEVGNFDRFETISITAPLHAHAPTHQNFTHKHTITQKQDLHYSLRSLGGDKCSR